MPTRRGFTMLTVLWVLGAAGIVAAAALVAGRNSAAATSNHVAWTRAHWRALGCARRVQSAIDSLLSGSSNEVAATRWRALNIAVSSFRGVSGCHIALEAGGATLDVNWATPEMLERFFIATGRPDFRELARDVVTMREDAPIPHVHALRRVSRAVDWTSYDSLLSVEPGRIALSAAPAAVLEAVPGVTPEIANAVIARRGEGHFPADLGEVLTLVSRTSARELEERFQEAAAVVTADPDAWLLRSSAQNGNPPITALIEWRITRQANHIIVTRSSVR